MEIIKKDQIINNAKNKPEIKFINLFISTEWEDITTSGEVVSKEATAEPLLNLDK